MRKLRGKISTTGYRSNSRDKSNDFNLIPGNSISMRGVEKPLMMIPLAFDKDLSLGNPAVGYPGENYLFPNHDAVLEVPIMAKGGPTPEKAREILEHGSIAGRPLTEKQRRFFGYIAAQNMQYGGDTTQDFIPYLDPSSNKAFFHEGGQMPRYNHYYFPYYNIQIPAHKYGLKNKPMKKMKNPFGPRYHGYQYGGVPEGYHMMPDGTLMRNDQMYKHGGNTRMAPFHNVSQQKYDAMMENMPCYDCGGPISYAHGGAAEEHQPGTQAAMLAAQGILPYNFSPEWLNYVAPSNDRSTPMFQPKQMMPKVFTPQPVPIPYNTSDPNKTFRTVRVKFNTGGAYSDMSQIMDEDIPEMKSGGKWIQKAAASMKRRGTEGAFTAYCGGKVTEECIRRGLNSPDPKIRRRAGFAKAMRTVARKQMGGDTQGNVDYFQEGDYIDNKNNNFLNSLASNAMTNMADQEADMMANAFQQGAFQYGGNPMSYTNDQDMHQDYLERFRPNNQDLMNKFQQIPAVQYQGGGPWIIPHNPAVTGITNNPWSTSLDWEGPGSMLNVETNYPQAPATSAYDYGTEVPIQPSTDAYTWQTGNENPFSTMKTTMDLQGKLATSGNVPAGTVKGRTQIGKYANPFLADAILAGTSMIGNVLEQGERRRKDKNFRKRMNADAIFTPNEYGNSGQRGDYDPNSGMFRPDDMVPVQFRGRSYKKGGEYTLSNSEIQMIMAHGGEIEFLD